MKTKLRLQKTGTILIIICSSVMTLFILNSCETPTANAATSTIMVAGSGNSLNTDIDYEVVILDDRTDSGIDIIKPDTSFYRKIANHFTELGSVCIAAIVVGNPPIEARTFARAYLREHIPIPVDAILSEEAKVKNQNRKINLQNQKSIREWLVKIDANIIRYKPDGQNLTKIQEPLDKAYKLLKEPVFQKSQKIMVIISDMVNEPSIEGKVEPLNHKLYEFENLKLISVGVREPNIFSNVVGHHNLESIYGLEEYLLTLK